MIRDQFERDGYVLLPGLLPAGTVADLQLALEALAASTPAAGVRDLMRRVPAIRALAHGAVLRAVVDEVLGAGAVPVRSVFFDKRPEANWNVAWHQDTSVALRAQHPVSGFGPWSDKQGIPHAEPPAHVLAQMLTLRVHLDPANPASGGLRVLPGSHRQGRVPSAEILRQVAEGPAVDCVAAPGDVLLMSPLLFHASRKASHCTRRRIIHLEYSALTLPPPLEWFETSGVGDDTTTDRSTHDIAPLPQDGRP